MDGMAGNDEYNVPGGAQDVGGKFGDCNFSISDSNFSRSDSNFLHKRKYFFPEAIVILDEMAEDDEHDVPGDATCGTLHS